MVGRHFGHCRGGGGFFKLALMNCHYLRLIAFGSTLAIVPASLGANLPQTLVPADLFATDDPKLEVTVWAASPVIKNPTNIDTDQFGRIWVAEGVNYRRHYDRQPEGDRITILEDTNGDGEADLQKTFYQGNEVNTALGICILGDRILVSCSRSRSSGMDWLAICGNAAACPWLRR